MMLIESVVEEFKARFGEMPELVARAPGRVNLIGEHTDYNQGFVLPMTIDRCTFIAFRKRQDSKIRITSLDYSETFEFDCSAPEKGAESWVEYVKGVAWAINEKHGEEHALTHGWDGVLAGNVPIGAGLSSSAAIELAVARALAAANDIAWDCKAMALACQRAENKWIGVQCGIMDQLISACGRAEHALLIDCSNLESESVPIPDDVVVVVMDTSTRRGLQDSAYNNRRSECEAAARFFGVQSLREVDIARFRQQEYELPEPMRRRARHVITEIDRTREAAEALKKSDATTFGRLMNGSHRSLRDDFEVSSAELDTIVSISQMLPGCHGARMTGAGFGGCAVALVKTENADKFTETVATLYEKKTGLAPAIYCCHAMEGASLLPGDISQARAF